MKCLILAAGYATRLYPLTENFPKPLLKVREKTILDWLIDDIDTLGAVKEYVVISNHKFADYFREWSAQKSQKITIVDDGTMSNETRLGAVCDIQYAIDALAIDDDILVKYFCREIIYVERVYNRFVNGHGVWDSHFYT